MRALIVAVWIGAVIVWSSAGLIAWTMATEDEPTRSVDSVVPGSVYGPPAPVQASHVDAAGGRCGGGGR